MQRRPRRELDIGWAFSGGSGAMSSTAASLGLTRVACVIVAGAPLGWRLGSGAWDVIDSTRLFASGRSERSRPGSVGAPGQWVSMHVAEN